MKRKLITLLLIVIIATLAYVYTRPPQPMLIVDKVYGIQEPGTTVLVNVTASNFATLGTWLMELAWDPTIVRLTANASSLTDGPFLESYGQTFVVSKLSNKNGTVTVGRGHTSGLSASGTGVILIINFTIIKVGTTSVEIRPPSKTLNQSIVGDAGNIVIEHGEINGLITDKPQPPMWASIDFQNTLIMGEVAVLAVATAIIYWRLNPRPPKSARRKAELQPIVDPKDQT